MGVLVQIRDVDASVRDGLKARAAARGMSLNSYLRVLLEDAAERPTIEEALATIAARMEKASASSVEYIRADRESRP